MMTTANAPGEQDRQQVAGLGQVERADLPGAGGDQLAVVGEVAGEEDGQRKLGELARLEVDRPDVDPDPRAADAEAEARHERQHQQHDPAEQQQPLVAGQVGARCTTTSVSTNTTMATMLHVVCSPARRSSRRVIMT